MNTNAVTTLQQQSGTPLATMTETAALLHMIERVSRDPSIDLDRLDRLMEMRDRVVKREAQVAFDEAFSVMQPELPVIDKKGRISGESKRTGDKLNQQHGRWEDISPAITPILAKHGFALRFRREQVQDLAGQVKDRTYAIVSHRCGHREEAYFDLPLDTTGSKNNCQAYGSTASYGKRYSATLALNIVTKNEDDDGLAAGTDLVTDEQIQEINLLMTATKANLQGFLAFFKIASLDQLPAKRLDEAIKMLNAKKAKGTQS